MPIRKPLHPILDKSIDSSTAKRIWDALDQVRARIGSLHPEPAVLPPYEPRIGDVVVYVESDGSERGVPRAAIFTSSFDGSHMLLSIIHPARVSMVPLKATRQDQETKTPGTWHRN